MKLGLLVAALLAFGGFSVQVTMTSGPIGFLTLAQEAPWAMQMLIDLCIVFSLFGAWMVGDARRLGINGWVYVPLLLAGSPGALIYLIRREWLLRSKGSTTATATT